MNDFDKRWDEHSKRHAKMMNNVDTFQKFFWVLWVFSAVLGLGVIGVMIWTIIRLVTKYG